MTCQLTEKRVYAVAINLSTQTNTKSCPARSCCAGQGGICALYELGEFDLYTSRK